MTELRWRIRLGDEAERDFEHILQTTKDKFGDRQLEIYRLTLIDALAALEAGPDISGSVNRSDVHPNLRTLHVARKGRRGRHFVLYRAAPGNVIDVIRILYDGMDLPRHIPTDLGNP